MTILCLVSSFVLTSSAVAYEPTITFDGQQYSALHYAVRDNCLYNWYVYSGYSASGVVVRCSIYVYIYIYIYIESFDFSGPHCQLDRNFSVRRVHSSPAALCMLK